MIEKEVLLNYEGFIDNEYLDKYCELVNKNIDRFYEKFKTQKHHIIPVLWYKYRVTHDLSSKDQDYLFYKKLADRDVNNCIVNLLYPDHVLAHYYLSLCTEGQIKFANQNAVFHVLGNLNFIFTTFLFFAIISLLYFMCKNNFENKALLNIFLQKY